MLLLVVYFDLKCVNVEKYNKIKLFLKVSTIRTYFVVKRGYSFNTVSVIQSPGFCLGQRNLLYICRENKSFILLLLLSCFHIHH